MVIFLLILLVILVCGVFNVLREIKEKEPATVTFVTPNLEEMNEDHQKIERILEKVDNIIIKMEPIVEYYKNINKEESEG